MSPSVEGNGLTGESYHDPLPWHHEFYERNNKHNKRCKVRLALEHLPESLEIKVLTYYGNKWVLLLMTCAKHYKPPSHRRSCLIVAYK